MSNRGKTRGHNFINRVNLALELKTSGSGIPLEDKLLCVLLYADDLVLLAENEYDLQKLLDIVKAWCVKWRLEVNPKKTKVLHVWEAAHKKDIFLVSV